MPDPVIGLIGFAISHFVIAMGVPVAVSLGIVGVVGYAFTNAFPARFS